MSAQLFFRNHSCCFRFVILWFNSQTILYFETLCCTCWWCHRVIEVSMARKENRSVYTVNHLGKFKLNNIICMSLYQIVDKFHIITHASFIAVGVKHWSGICLCVCVWLCVPSRCSSWLTGGSNDAASVCFGPSARGLIHLLGMVFCETVMALINESDDRFCTGYTKIEFYLLI